MHSYSTDNEFRPKFLALLGVGVYLLTTVVNSIVIPTVWNQLPLPQEATLGLTFGIGFLIVYTVFEKVLWRSSWMPSRIASVPDLSGHWEGHINTNAGVEIEEEYISEDDNPNDEYTQIPASVDITQSWRMIEVHFETERSASTSTSGSFRIEQTRHPNLSYQFKNDGPSPDEMRDDEGPYDGATQFKYKQQSDELVGYYYTGPSRNNTHGSARFTRISKPPGIISKIKSWVKNNWPSR